MHATGDETERLMRQAHAGDDGAIQFLLQRYRSRLKQMVHLRMDPRIRPRVDPSDVVQDAMVTASKQLREYFETQPIPLYPWLRRIVWEKLVHAHERHLDAQKRSVRNERRNAWDISDDSVLSLARVIEGNLTSPSGAAVRNEIRLRVRDALAQLTELDREVLLERYVEQLSVKEIAAVLKTTAVAVRMRHMRALEKLHRLLSREDAGDVPVDD